MKDKFLSEKSRKILAALLIVAAGFFFSPSESANAQGVGLVNAFGGVIEKIIPCTCTGAMIINVKDVRGITIPLFYQPFVSRLNMFYMPMIGNYVLGTFFPAPLPCLEGVAPLCFPAPIAAIGFVTTIPFSGMGTSGVPSPGSLIRSVAPSAPIPGL